MNATAISSPFGNHATKVHLPETAPDCAARELSIPSALNRVEHLIERLMKSGLALSDRLTPVTRPQAPVPCAPNSNGPSALPSTGTAMSDHLHRLADRLESIECGLNDLASRLEI